MKRELYSNLREWKDDQLRKVLILKGARQVGKSYLVREFGKEFNNFVEINFDSDRIISKVFDTDLDPIRIVNDISNTVGKEIVPGKTLLFFDEIQESENALKSLRYFYEKMPDLHLIAAGSLLDFMLSSIGIPVGRVQILYLYPLSFKEFVVAKDKQFLLDSINKESLNNLAVPIHKKMLRLWSEYMAVGGMPEVVFVWIKFNSLKKCRKIQEQLIETYRQDFEKYAKKNQIQLVEMVFAASSALIGKKFVYSSIDSGLRSRDIKPALNLLEKAGIIYKIIHSSSGILPLKANIKPEFFKIILLDIGLTQAMLDLDVSNWLIDYDDGMNKGAIVEAFVGQELLAYSEPEKKAELFYWAREKRGSSAEIDYVISHEGFPLPIEVKSGKSIKMKSMEIFLKEKKSSKYGVHFSQLDYGINGNIQRFPIYSVCLF